MLQNNKKLHKAKKAKNDEFYTRLEDIEKELNEYDPAVFKDKTIFCNCDDPTSSNFWVFFHINFHRLGLKKLIATHYNIDGSSSYEMEYDGQDPKDNIDFSKGTKIPLKGNGDFRSSECIDLLKQSDMVVTNPPFSLFREFVAQLEQYHKKFIIWGNNNAITYKEIFPLIKEGKLWLGYLTNKTCWFKLSPDYPKWDEKFTAKMNDGSHYGKVPAISTFTNIDTKKRHRKLETDYRWRKHKEKYPDLYSKYDNYDAIEVGKVLQIPLDYNGAMGVPITFLGKYNPEQFEILGITSGRKEYDKRAWPTKHYLNALQYKQDGTTSNGSKVNTGPMLLINAKPTKGVYYTADNVKGYLLRKYDRILIRNKHPEDYKNK